MKTIQVLRWVGFVLLCGIPLTAVGSAISDAADNSTSRLEQSKKFCVLDFPALANLALPEVVRDLLETVVIDHSDMVACDDGSMRVATEISFFGQTMAVQLVVLPSQEVVAEIMLPNGWALSNMFPAFAQFDLFSCKDMRLIISSFEYTGNLRGSIVKPGGEPFRNACIEWTAAVCCLAF